LNGGSVAPPSAAAVWIRISPAACAVNAACTLRRGLTASPPGLVSVNSPVSCARPGAPASATAMRPFTSRPS
jgi:hypothetical protein